MASRYRHLTRPVDAVLAVDVRRLHDIGTSGWWLLIALIPHVGAIVLLVFACQDSEPGTNQWGPSPKYGA